MGVPSFHPKLNHFSIQTPGYLGVPPFLKAPCYIGDSPGFHQVEASAKMVYTKITKSSKIVYYQW